MSKKILSLLLIFTLVSCRSGEVKFSLKNGLFINNARIISPEDESLSDDCFIVIEGDEIVFVGANEPKLSGNYKTLDAQGKFIIPGLIDSHVHITSTDVLSEKEELENPDIVKKFREQLPKSYLYFGYTTIIDLGTSRPERIFEFNKAETKPDLYYVGGAAVIGNGYGLTNWKDDTPNFIYLENKDYPISEKYSKQNHTPTAVVKRIAESGAIAVKTYYEPGFDPTRPPLPVPTNKLIEELKIESQKNDLLLIAHGNSLQAHEFLAKADVDIIAHGLWNWDSFTLDSSNQIPNEIARVLDIEIKNRIGYMPTIQVIKGLITLTDPSFLEDPELKNVLPNNLIAYYKENAIKMNETLYGSIPKDVVLESFNQLAKQGRASLQYINKHNGIILFSTDTPSNPTFGTPPGYNGYLEMVEMERAGIPLGKILASATIDNAKAFKLENKYGTVEKGKKANILLLNKNPLQDIAAYNDISIIIMEGKSLKRNTLSAKGTDN